MKPITESMRRLVEAERRAARRTKTKRTRKAKARKKKRGKVIYTRLLDRMKKRRRIPKLAN
jgi:hypothetical protein